MGIKLQTLHVPYVGSALPRLYVNKRKMKEKVSNTCIYKCIHFEASAFDIYSQVHTEISSYEESYGIELRVLPPAHVLVQILDVTHVKD